MEAENNQLHGVYDTEEDLKAEMSRLKDQGYADSDMYIVSYENQRTSMYRGTEEYNENVNEEASWWDRFKAFMVGEDTTRDTHFDSMGISHEDRDRYYEDLRNGKFLLYVDKNYGNYFDEHVSKGEARRHDDHATDHFADNTHMTRDEPRDLNDTLSKTKPIGYDPTFDDHQKTDDERLHESKPVGYDNEETVRDQEVDNTKNFGHENRFDAQNNAQTEEDNTKNFSHENRFDAQNNAQTEEERLALHEERLEVDKNRVQTGEVQVDKRVVEEEKTFDVPVEREEVHIERRPVTDSDAYNADNAQRSHAYEEDGSIHIPVTKEEVEVTKKDVVTEEIIINKETVKDTETVSENLRREEVDIHRTGDDTTEHATDFNRKRDDL